MATLQFDILMYFCTYYDILGAEAGGKISYDGDDHSMYRQLGRRWLIRRLVFRKRPVVSFALRWRYEAAL